MHPIDVDGKACGELCFERHMAKCVLDDSNMADDDIVVVQMLLAGPKKAVIQRSTDLLTKEEMTTNRVELEAAILEELRTWIKYKCFDRAPRKGARNVMDSRFVAKWKVTIDIMVLPHASLG